MLQRTGKLQVELDLVTDPRQASRLQAAVGAVIHLQSTGRSSEFSRRERYADCAILLAVQRRSATRSRDCEWSRRHGINSALTSRQGFECTVSRRRGSVVLYER